MPKKPVVKAKKRAAKVAPRKVAASRVSAKTPEQLREDKLAIREVVENWIVFRDSGLWDKFITCWHSDGYMMATWFQGTAAEFTKVSRDGFERGVSIMHFLGGSNIELAGKRAIAMTKMTISQRAPVHGVVVDVLCSGRFYDFFEKRDGRWAIVLRRLFYEKDRMDPVDPSQQVKLEPEVLQSFPVGYQHLAYLQSKLGFPVKKNMPGLRGPDADALYAHGRNWLDGKPIDAAKM